MFLYFRFELCGVQWDLHISCHLFHFFCRNLCRYVKNANERQKFDLLKDTILMMLIYAVMSPKSLAIQSGWQYPLFSFNEPCDALLLKVLWLQGRNIWRILLIDRLNTYIEFNERLHFFEKSQQGRKNYKS